MGTSRNRRSHKEQKDYSSSGKILCSMVEFCFSAQEIRSSWDAAPSGGKNSSANKSVFSNFLQLHSDENDSLCASSFSDGTLISPPSQSQTPGLCSQVQEEKAIQIGQDSLHQQILSAIYFMHSDLDGIDQNVHPKS